MEGPLSFKEALMEAYAGYEDTSQIPIPKDPLLRVIGQQRAVKIAKAVAYQRRHLLLVGPPGVGKSMLARAIASLLGKPNFQISVLHNERRPERPILKVESFREINKSKEGAKKAGKLISPSQAPIFVTEELGYRCRRCGELSNPSVEFCPGCGARKFRDAMQSPFADLVPNIAQPMKRSIRTMRQTPDGRRETIIYEEAGDYIRELSEKEARKRRVQGAKKKVLVPINRSLFVSVAGASETELLGDVQHDPYGGHPEIGTPAYLRVVPGAIHEAHEGVLYVDELASFSYELQKSILTAMQEKKFSIVGRNATSTGAIVRVDDVPCDFILVGAINVSDLQEISPALRSRIRGEGYELLMDTTMEDNEENRASLAQFVAQEIQRDGKIPHASRAAVDFITEKAKEIAKDIDGKEGLTLRLRNLAGVVRLAGDIAKTEGSSLIEKEHVAEALENAKSIEQQLAENYDNWWNASLLDYGVKKSKGSGVM